MSYILDALRKAEHERHLGQPPSLAALPPAQPTNQRLWLWLSLGLGLGFNAALLAYFLIQPKSAPEPAAVATTPAGAPSPSTATARAPQTALAPIPPPAAAPPVTPTDSGVSAKVATDRETAASEPAPAPAPPAPPRKKATGNPVSTDPARPSNSASRERREDSKTAAGPTVTIGPEPPPLLDTLPAAARRGLPELNLDIHVYSPKPGARFVVINGRRYREGDPVEKGAVLESVTPGGAVLRQGGQRFQLSVRR